MNIKQKDKGKEVLNLLDKLTPAEQCLLKKHFAKTQQQHEAPKIKLNQAADKSLGIAPDGDNQLLSQIALWDAFGTVSPDFQSRIMFELINAAGSNGIHEPVQQSEVNGMIAAMHGIGPCDETEGMLAAQMVATNTLAMHFLHELRHSKHLSMQAANGNLAIKLLRLYPMQMEALNRYRGKGQQKVTVEHVNVHPGGQAIVGNVNHSGGGGVKQKPEEQPHALHIDYAPMPTMPSQNTQQQPVSVSCHA